MSETVVRINSELEAGLVAEAPSYALGAVRETDEVYTLDLLGTDIYMSTGAIKAPQHQLEHSFFSLSTRNSPKSSKYVHNDVTINIDCPVGVPNTKDSDVIVFLTSKAMLVQSKSRKQDGTEITPRRISFSPREFLEFTERGFGSNSYQSLYLSLIHI